MPFALRSVFQPLKTEELTLQVCKCQPLKDVRGDCQTQVQTCLDLQALLVFQALSAEEGLRGRWRLKSLVLQVGGCQEVPLQKAEQGVLQADLSSANGRPAAAGKAPPLFEGTAVARSRHSPAARSKTPDQSPAQLDPHAQKASPLVKRTWRPVQ